MGMEIYLQFHGVICNALYVSWNYCVAYLNVAKMLTKSRSKGNWGGWWTVLASDVVYNEDVVPELLKTLQGLTGLHTTVLLAGELRNDAVLECFFTCALVDFVVGRVRESDWHPDFRSSRVAVYVLSRRKTGVRLEFLLVHSTVSHPCMALILSAFLSQT
jgi:hypothetical protein